MIQRCIQVAALATALVLPATAEAHHSGAMFDQQKSVTLAGTVRQFEWINPHCFIQLSVQDPKGGTAEWSLEMTAPIHLQRLGWHRNSLKPGDRITVTFHPLRNGDKGGNVTQVIGADGKAIGRPA